MAGETKEHTEEIENYFINNKGNKIEKLVNIWPLECINFKSTIENTTEQLTSEMLENKLKNPTAEREYKYTITSTTNVESNSYQLEVTQVDNWFEYYEKTYSDVEAKDTGNGTNVTDNELQVKVDPDKEITEGFDSLDYIQSITQEAKDNLVEKVIGIANLKDKKLEIKKILQRTFKYGTETITTESTGTKYVRSGTEKELTEIKVQNNNKNVALLTIKADESVLDEEESKNSELENESIYQTTSARSAGFLSIYDKGEYSDVRSTMDSIDNWMYEWMNNSNSSSSSQTLLQYLLFLYNGKDYGTTEYDLTWFKPGEFKEKRFRGNALVEWLRSYENNWLREYRNGTASEGTKRYVFEREFARENGDEIQYGVEEMKLSTDHSLNYSYGLLFYAIDNNAYYYEQEFQNHGLPSIRGIVAAYQSTGGNNEGTWVNADEVDAIQVEAVTATKQDIIDAYLDAGIELTNYEADALTAMSYAYGMDGAGIKYSSNMNLIKAYKEALEAEDEEKISQTKANIINNFRGSRGRPFIYEQNATRGENLRLMFFDGRYILSTGEEISAWCLGSLADWEGPVYESDLYIFPVYNQMTDTSWDIYAPFGGPQGRPGVPGNNGYQKTISSSGCGCCSLACILSGYTGELITPDILTNVLDDTYPTGYYYSPGDGSRDCYFTTNDVVSQFGCSAKACGSYAEAMEALNNGYAVIGGEDGHLLALVPASSEDKAAGYVFRIIDSARNHNYLCGDFEEGGSYVRGGILFANAIIYPDPAD